MLAKRHTALSPHWAAARHARSTRPTDGSTPELEQAAAPDGDLAAGPAGHAEIPVLERLAASAREGDRSALQELASLLQPSVWRFAYHLSGNREIAEEACQETWARVIRALPGFRAESSITTWLLAIARRVTAGLLADQRRNSQRSISSTFHPPPSQSSAFETVSGSWATYLTRILPFSISSLACPSTLPCSRASACLWPRRWRADALW